MSVRIIKFTIKWTQFEVVERRLPLQILFEHLRLRFSTILPLIQIREFSLRALGGCLVDSV